MSKRADGFTILIDMQACGWARAGFPGMRNKQGTANAIYQYMETGQFTRAQYRLYLQQMVTHYRKWCFEKGRTPVKTPISWEKHFQKDKK